jgi:hypothetical protein
MAEIRGALQGLVESVVDFVVLILLGIISFYVTVFVVVTGANLANVQVAGDFVVLAAALIVASSILAGRRKNLSSPTA